MKYSEQKELVERYNVLSGQNVRVNCPACGGKKTLSVSKFDGRLVWNCFKASCEVGGKDFVGRNNAELKNALGGGSNTFQRKAPEIPRITGNPIGHPEVEKYLEDNNCRIAFDQKLIRIEYAPAEKRVLLYNPSEKGCVGRSLVRGTKPKWKAYGDTSELFTVGVSKKGVIVEDAASACAVAATGEYSGVCLLGTHLNREQKRTIVEQYENIIISLDKDASRKSIIILQELRGLIKASVKLLEVDLKQYNCNDIRRVLT